MKDSNYWIVYDWAVGRPRPEMQGTKLAALYKLIQLKGEPIKSSDPKLNGVKALEIRDGEWIAIRKAPIGNPTFPCMMHTYLITKL